MYKYLILIIKIFLCFRFQVFFPDGVFYTYYPNPSDWFHIVLNFIGPNNDEEGIWVYYNGAEVVNDTFTYTNDWPDGDGRIVVGRQYTDDDKDYSSVQVDELTFFNKALRLDDIKLLYNTV